ncbi:MSC_0775 family lipoprotein [Mycoplasmopsis agalactiae]|uniref:MSC_0775 family lipoprotein n=1 Tax=Mycoplasmopsis agalactiae TaxID=2110 RepID=UPI002F41B999
MKSKKLKAIFISQAAAFTALLPVLSAKCNDPKNNSDVIIHNSNSNKTSELFEKYNQVNLLANIKDYFDKNDHSELIKFEGGGKPESVEYSLMIQNNYMSKYIKLDTKAFKTIVKEKLNYSDELLNRLKFSYDYNNVTRDPGNNYDVLFKVKVGIPLASNDKAKYPNGLYSQQIIDFKLKNVKVKDSEKPIADALRPYYEKIQALTSQDFEVKLQNIDEELIQVIKKHGIHELSSKQYEKLLTATSSKLDEIFKEKDKEIEIKVGNKSEKYTLKFSKFIEDIDLSSADLGGANAKIRIGVSLFDTKKKTTVWEAGKTVLGKFSVPKEQKLLSDLQLGKLIDVHTIGNIEHNSDLSALTKSNLFVNVKSAKIEKVEIEKIETNENDFRNATVILNVKVTGESNPIKLEKHLGVGRYSLLFEEQFTKQNINAPAFATEGITTKNLPSIDKTFFGHYNSQLFSGGYASARAFYSDNIVVPKFLHIGEDYLAPDYQPVLAPYDGQIVAAYELTTKVVATGVGTVVVIKIPVGNLDWSPKEKELYLNGNDKHIYMSFLHLDAGKTLNNTALGWQSETVTLGKDRTIKVAPTVSADTPTEVKKGQIIGFLGTQDTNGGWMAHAHVNLYTNRNLWLSPNHFNKVAIQSNIDKRVKEYKKTEKDKTTYRNVGNIGVEGVLNPKAVHEVDPKTGLALKDGQGKDKVLKELRAYVDTISMLSREQSKGYADPNLVYKLRDSRTFAFGIEDLFELNK